MRAATRPHSTAPIAETSAAARHLGCCRCGSHGLLMRGGRAELRADLEVSHEAQPTGYEHARPLIADGRVTPDEVG
jgi:hypothetical protein